MLADFFGRSCFAPKMGFRIGREVVVWFSDREGLDELIVVEDSVRFPCSPARGDVFDSGTYEYDCAAVIRYALQCELVHEAFDVKLPQHEFLHRFVVTEKAHVFMRFTFRVLFLRWVDRPIPDVNKAIIHDEGVFALGLARAGLSFDLAFPFAEQGVQRLPGICLFSWFW